MRAQLMGQAGAIPALLIFPYYDLRVPLSSLCPNGRVLACGEPTELPSHNHSLFSMSQ